MKYPEENTQGGRCSCTQHCSEQNPKGNVSAHLCRCCLSLEAAVFWLLGAHVRILQASCTAWGQSVSSGSCVQPSRAVPAGTISTAHPGCSGP